jgi:hypothetical protein
VVEEAAPDHGARLDRPLAPARPSAIVDAVLKVKR